MRVSFHFGRVSGAVGLALAGVAMTVSAQAAEPADLASQPTRMTLDACVAEALTQNVDVRSAAEEVGVAESQRAAERGHFGPKIHVDGSIQRWNEPYVFGGIPVHEATVWNVTASATQPITGLLAIYDAYKVRDLGVDVAAVRHEAAKRETAFRVVESYYRLAQAQRLGEVAFASVEQLTAQLRQANSFHTNGVVSRDDVLRAELALAGARQRLIQTRARITLERGRLAVLMGRPPESAIDPVPTAVEDLPAREPLSLKDAQGVAETQRVELREVDKRMDMADHETKVAYLRLLPQVNLVGAYIHNEGSLFSQINAGYIGGVAGWDVWDWGTNVGGVSEAKARARQAALARSKIDDQIRLEVRQAFVGVDTATEAMDVAKAAVASAEENFRLVKKRYDANAATSFDVVDAEALLTQARGQMSTTLYDLVIARAALRVATGAPATRPAP